MPNENGRTLAGVVAELRDQLKEFVATRISMLRSELKDKASAWKIALPLIVVALVLFGTAWLVLTGALIAIIAAAFAPSPFAPFFALIIVGVAYALLGVICASFGIREFRESGVIPHRTLRVLKEDQIWLQTEARTQI
ncbi:MAG: phage holin family protein [Terriglobales bacterium]